MDPSQRFQPSAHLVDSTRFGRLAHIPAGVSRQSSSIIEAVAADASGWPKEAVG
jgi:hypothetical protein